MLNSFLLQYNDGFFFTKININNFFWTRVELIWLNTITIWFFFFLLISFWLPKLGYILFIHSFIPFFYPTQTSLTFLNFFFANPNLLLINILNKYHPALFYFNLLLWVLLWFNLNFQKIDRIFIFNKLKFQLRTYIFKNFINLSFMLSLGGWWAYQEGSWGGWWNWDPSEVFGLFFFATAVILFHSPKLNIIRYYYNFILLTLGFFIIFFELQINFELLSHNFDLNFLYFFSNNFFFTENILSFFLFFILTSKIYTNLIINSNVFNTQQRYLYFKIHILSYLWAYVLYLLNFLFPFIFFSFIFWNVNLLYVNLLIFFITFFFFLFKKHYIAIFFFSTNFFFCYKIRLIPFFSIHFLIFFFLYSALTNYFFIFTTLQNLNFFFSINMNPLILFFTIDFTLIKINFYFFYYTELILTWKNYSAVNFFSFIASTHTFLTFLNQLTFNYLYLTMINEFFILKLTFFCCLSIMWLNYKF